MAELKTKRTGASVREYIAMRANEQQRVDCRDLMAMLKSITGHSPKMWGPSIVGYGSYRHVTAGGRASDMPLAAFAIRGRDLVVYLSPEADGQKALLSRLGKHKMGVSCLYFRQLADLDKAVLRQLIADSMADAKRRHA